MSAIGTKQTWAGAPHMSAFGGKADITNRPKSLALGPTRPITTARLKLLLRVLWGPCRNAAMPALGFLALVGLVLIASLFVADATLEPASPVIVTSQRSGLPVSRHPEAIQGLSTAPAPAPDMTSQAVLAAQPKSAPDALAKIESAAREARAEVPPKKARVEASAKKARAEAPPQNQHVTQPSYLTDRFSIKGY